MEAPAEKSVQAKARAEKKAARRAAFIQEVAVAVWDEMARRDAAYELAKKGETIDAP